jgi:DNA gyrase subunit A
MQVAKPGGRLLTVTERGYAKQTELDEYRVTGRGGLGVKNVEITDKNGPVVNIAQLHDNDELLVITEQGKILRTPGNDIRTAGRATQGVRLMDLEEGDRVVSVALVPSSGEDMADEAAVEPLAADPGDGESGPEEPQA